MVTRWSCASAAPRALGVVFLALALRTGVAGACTIDNRTSLVANGVLASITPTSPTGARLWAPFTINKSFARRETVQFSELWADLRKTMAPMILAQPFRWSFGDGATALGHVVTHRYTRSGTYLLMVYGFYSPRRQWFPFDQALVRIVAPDQVVQANLGYYAGQAVSFVSSGPGWACDAALVLLLLSLPVRRWKPWRRTQRAPSLQSAQQRHR
jgi:hypothetical protein